MYFNNIQKDDKVYGLVFGKGIVSEVFPTEGFYQFEVDFDNGYKIPYTKEGVPGWGNFSEQTLFYRKDIDKSTFDFSDNCKSMSYKKLVKCLYSSKNILEVKTPSGIWHKSNEVDKQYIQDIISNGLFFLFRTSN